MTELKWIACLFHINETEYDYIENTLNEYDIGKYLIGHEKEPYHHYHIAFEGTDKMYNAFAKRLIEKYELRGKATKGKSRQYGRLKKIEDIEKLLVYSCKDGNVRGNFTQEEIEKFVEKSFKKDDRRDWIREVRQYVESQKIRTRYTNSEGKKYYQIRVLRMKIMEYYRKKEITFNQNNIKSCINNIIQHSENQELRMTLEELDEYYFY